MIGIVTGVLSGISVIDADTYKMTENELSSYREKFPIPKTPTSISPKSGEHYYFKYHAELPQRSEIYKHVDGRNNGGYIVAPPSSSNGHGGYSWKLKIGDTPLHPLPEDILSVIKNYIYNRGGVIGGGISRGDIKDISDISDIQQGERDQEIFHLANMLIKGGCKEEEVIKYVMLFAMKCCDPPFPIKEAKEKVLSALKRDNIRERNIAAEVREWVNVTSCDFLVTSMVHEVTLVTSKDKIAARQAIKRLCDEGVIERSHRGYYRVIDKDVEKIDLKSKMIELTDKKFKGLDISYPFGIERFIWTYPKSVIVIAGSKGAGKTAFSLNFARLNQNKHKVLYFNSEMGEDEFTSRVMGFDESGPDEWKFEPFVRSSNFHDVIQPDAINIIDFLEKEDEFWTIGRDIKNIWEKLRGGIALICIQKDINAKRGRGGDFSREKARLYLTLDYDEEKSENTLKIMDAKNWRNPQVNPRGQYIKYKLFHGVQFGKQSAWMEDYEK